MSECKKILKGVVDTTNYLSENNFTYDQAEEFLKILVDQISHSRRCDEYETIDDFFKKRPCCIVGKKVVSPIDKEHLTFLL